MERILTNDTPLIEAAICYLGMNENLVDGYVVLNYGKCILEQGTGRRIAIEQEIAVRLNDERVLVAIPSTNQPPAIHAHTGRLAAFDRTNAAIEAIAIEFVLPLYQ